MRIRIWLFVVLLSLYFPGEISTVHAQEANHVALHIEGLGAAPVTINWSQLLALKHQRVSEKRRLESASGKSQEVVTSRMTGATLADVLSLAGYSKLGRHEQRRTAFIAIAADGYEAAFSWAEVFLNDSGSGMLVLWERNGVALIHAEGPLALISLNDARTGPRHVKKLIRLKVLNVQ